MDETHEINRLDLQIDGKIDYEIQQAIHETLVDVIEAYFDKYDLQDSSVLIDKIQFDLGSIKASNFKEELIVRLSYLLNEELQKFFGQTGIKDQIDEKIIVSNTNAFIAYLQKGYSKFNDKDLSQLFDHLLRTDISLLRGIMREVSRSPTALERLFYQVKYESLVEYWTKVYPQEFQIVELIENQILVDSGYFSSNEYKQESIGGLLRKLTFNFMMEESGVQAGAIYLERLKDHVDEFKSYEHTLKKSAFKYLDNLSRKFLKGTVDSVERKDDKPDSLENIIDYIITGGEAANFSKSSLASLGRQLAEKELKKLATRLTEVKEVKQIQFERIRSIFTIKQFENFLSILMQTGNNNLAMRIAEISYFRAIVKELFKEDIYTINLSELSKYLITTSSSDKKLTQLIARYVDFISAKNRIKSVEIVKKLSKRIDRSVHGHARVFNKHVKQLQSKLGESEDYGKGFSTDLMYAYIHFLKSGVWVLEKETPQEVLIKLLEERPEHLTIELSRHLGMQTVWLRLVYQHQVEVIRTVFETVFKGDKDLNLLLAKLGSIESVELKELLQRKLMESFITAKVLQKSNSEFSFETIFEKTLIDYSFESKTHQEGDYSNVSLDMDHLILTYLINIKHEVKLDQNQRSFIIGSISSHPHFLSNYLFDRNISKVNWERFLKAFDRNELFQLLKVILTLQFHQIRWISSLINGLDDDELVKLLGKPKLIILAVILIKGDEQDIESFIVKLLKGVKEKEVVSVEKLTSILPSVDLIEPSTSTYNLLIKGTVFSNKELAKAVASFVDNVSILKGDGVSISSVQWNNLLLDILPFVKTAKELEEKLLVKLIDYYPQYFAVVPSIKSISSKEDVKGFTFFVNELIESDSANVQPYFVDFGGFERYFVQVLQRPDYFDGILSTVEPHRLVKFLKRLTTATLEILDKLILRNFAPADFLVIKGLVIETNNNLRQEINYFSIAYGLTHYRFDSSVFLRYIDVNIPYIQLPSSAILVKTDESSIEILPALYVEALIHYLKFKKHIYMPLEQDGLHEGLSKIISYWPEELLVQLRESTAIQQLVENLLLVVSESRQIGIFTQLFPYQIRQVDYAFEKISEVLKITKVKFLSTWAELNLTRRGVFNLSQTIAQLLTILKPVDKLSTPLQQIVMNKGAALSGELPLSLISQVIRITEVKHFTVSELTIELIHTGKIPIWLKVQTSTEFTSLFKEIVKKLPEEIRKIFNDKLKNLSATRHVHKVIGITAFQDIIKILEPKSFNEIMQQVEKLAKIHRSLGQQEALIEYFFIRYVTEFYETGKTLSRIIIANILSKVAFDFGLSSTDYKELLKNSNEKIIKEYFAESNSPEPEEPEFGIVYQIDFLLHLVTKNELPWWASWSPIKTQLPIEKQIAELVMLLFEKDPKALINSISGKVITEQIYQRLLPNITNQQFDRILLILAPNFGGFMVSFNLLIIRCKVKVDRSSWFSFLLRIAFETNSFKATIFVAKALSMASKFANENIEKLRLKLLDIAKTAIKKGEMRFLPFIELLATKYEESKNLIVNPDKSNKIDAMGFVETVVYYVRTGSVPHGSLSQFRSYLELTNLIERQIQFGHNELRLAISKAITDEKIRTRIIKYESEHFLDLIVRILQPSEGRKVLFRKNEIIRLLKQKWIDVSTKVLDEIFYRSIFEQVLENQPKAIGATDLVVLFILKAGQLLNREIKFSNDELKDFELEGKFTRDAKDLRLKKQSKRTTIELPLLGDEEDSLVDHRVLVKNAGLVIIWPYLTRFFELLEMSHEGKFKSEADAIRAVHLLQYLATGTTKAPEHELLLNKVLCGLKVATPVPMEVVLTKKETETSQMMLKGLLQNWDRLKNSSIEALREGFLVRDGYILEKEKTWELKVEKKTLDILMENMPWAFGTIKLPWMEKRLNVEWL